MHVLTLATQGHVRSTDFAVGISYSWNSAVRGSNDEILLEKSSNSVNHASPFGATTRLCEMLRVGGIYILMVEFRASSLTST